MHPDIVSCEFETITPPPKAYEAPLETKPLVKVLPDTETDDPDVRYIAPPLPWLEIDVKELSVTVA